MEYLRSTHGSVLPLNFWLRRKKHVTLMKRISLLHATHCQLESEFSWLWVQRYSRDSSGSPAALVVFGPSPVLTPGSPVSIHRTSTKYLVFGEESDFCTSLVVSRFRAHAGKHSLAQVELSIIWQGTCSSSHNGLWAPQSGQDFPVLLSQSLQHFLNQHGLRVL